MTKTLISIFFTAAFSGFAGAQVCSSLPKEAKTYRQQELWQKIQISDPNVPGAITGYVDGQNHFYFEDLSRRGTYRAQVHVSPKNEDFKNFFKYCASWQDRGFQLNRLRQEGPKAKYTVDITYLPAMKGFGNDPLKDQEHRVTSHDFDLKISEESASLNDEIFKEEYRAELYHLVKKQLESQKEFGKIRLDLTGYDDFACDLIQGNAVLVIKKSDFSKSALIKQETAVNPEDIQTLNGEIQTQIPKNLKKEALLFKLGFLSKELEMNRRIEMDEESIFKVVSHLLNKDGTRIQELNPQELSCLSDQMQIYKRTHVQHLFNIGLKFDPLESIESESERTND